MNTPLLSVCLITYNHENYILQAIEGVLMQEVDFEWELIIADDCSTDRTREIVLEYKSKYPDFIKLILQEKNVGPAKNWMDLLATPQSKYIAYFEGDDYWTDPLKLQKQVDFLDNNNEYVLCFHPVDILKTSGIVTEDFITEVPKNHEAIEDLALLGNYIHTPSVVFRNIIKQFPVEFMLSPIGDFFLYMLLAESGRFKYLEEKMSVYREGVGIWSSRSAYLKDFNTAYTHALLVSTSKFSDMITNILLSRIALFLEAYGNQIDFEKLCLLNTCPKVNTLIYTSLLKERENIRLETINMKTSKQLLTELLKRGKKRLW
ncbi:glycosyltransferase [Flavobacterium sp. WC2421]|uniref:glycosyltransferase family 2 protein n=1 Tax=Flavobacterium sp. WC2421 TaxID=3234138 RepID=UPI00346683A9